MADVILKNSSGNDVLYEGIRSVSLLDQNQEEVRFSIMPSVITRRALDKGNTIRFTSEAPSSEDTPALITASANILVPSDEEIVDISYIAGMYGGAFRKANGIGMTPNVAWNNTDPTTTVTQTTEEGGIRVQVSYDMSGDPNSGTLWNALKADIGSVRGTVFLIVTSQKE